MRQSLNLIKSKKRFLLLGLVLILFTKYAQAADWYETTGWAPIVKNAEQAREQAIEHALRQSLDLAGGQLQSVEEVVNGVITGQRIQWQSQGAIEQVELVRERRNKQRFEVTLRVLVRPNVQNCNANQYRPNVAILPFSVAHKAHLNHGQLYGIEQASAFRFSRLLAQNSQALTVRQLVQAPHSNLLKYIQLNHRTELAQYSRKLAREYASQYIFAGVFHDLSTYKVREPRVFVWRHPDYHRQFELSLYILDGYSGELITTASIQDSTPWNFKYNESVDVQSEAFWQSSFGQQLQVKMRDLVYGIEPHFQCKPLKGLVVRAENNQLYSDLGRDNNLELGNKAQILHRSGFLDELGQYHEQWILNPSELEVIELYGSSSVLRSIDGKPITGLQNRDLVLFK